MIGHDSVSDKWCFGLSRRLVQRLHPAVPAAMQVTPAVCAAFQSGALMDEGATAVQRGHMWEMALLTVLALEAVHFDLDYELPLRARLMMCLVPHLPLLMIHCCSRQAGGVHSPLPVLCNPSMGIRLRTRCSPECLNTAALPTSRARVLCHSIIAQAAANFAHQRPATACAHTFLFARSLAPFDLLIRAVSKHGSFSSMRCCTRDRLIVCPVPPCAAVPASS